LLLCVDDFGFFKGDPIEVKNAAYPKRDMLSKEIIPAMDKLSETGLIFRYEVDGEAYLMVTHFINTPRAKVSKYPAPDGHYITKSEWNDDTCNTIEQQMQAIACNLQANAPLTVTVTETETVNRNRKSAARKCMHGTQQNVYLTDEELETLAKDFPAEYKEAVDFLSEYISEKGYKSKSHYMAIRRWVIDAVREKRSKKAKYQEKPKQNFQGVEYDEEFLKSLEVDPVALSQKLKEEKKRIMREIKFRGKLTTGHGWAEGNLNVCENGVTIGLCVCVNPETVGQYTGMRDKNGVGIYEGDIVEAWSQGIKGRGEIKQRNDGLWIFYPAWQSKRFWGLMPSLDGTADVEVIGNIHDNPELLDGGENLCSTK
jgi:phage uncharacterized protein TIGR01671